MSRRLPLQRTVAAPECAAVFAASSFVIIPPVPNLLDAGAGRALVDRGGSLLPAGIVEVRGSFHIGDPVSCIGVQGGELARGLTAYPAEDVERIKGLATREISIVLGYSNGDEVIHRDDLVVLER